MKLTGFLAKVSRMAVVSSMLWFALASPEPLAYAQAQCPGCVTCHDFCALCDGYVTSPGSGGCGDYKCICVGPTAPRYGTRFHPGLLTEEVAGRLVVSAVLQGSPAQEAGILPGDQILAVNGAKPGTSCGNLGWDSGQSSKMANLSLLRGDKELRLEVPLAPVETILESWWSSRGRETGGLTLVSSTTPPRRRTHSYGAYMLGLTWVRQGGYLAVSDVLSGSPAQYAGISVGDRITAVDGARVGSASATVLSRLRPADHRVRVLITLWRAGQENQVVLGAAGMSGILRHIARPAESPGSLALLGLER